MPSVAELFVLFGLQPDKGSFSEGLGLLKSLRNAARQYIGVEAVKSLVGFVEHAAQAGTHITGMATSLGMSTQTFQEWSYVAKRAGSDASQFAVGVSMFERNLLEFSRGRGGKRFQDAMALVGISSADAAKMLTKPDGVNDALFRIADAYKKGGINAKDAAINTSLFGQRARGMAQDLAQGSGPLKEQIAHLHEIGGVVDDKSLANLKQLNNGIVDMRTAFNGLSLEAVGTLAPELTKLANEGAKWIAAHRELIEGVIEAAVNGLVVAFKALGLAIEFVENLVTAALGGDTGAQAILIGIGATILSIVVPALYAMAVAAWASIGPYVLLAAGLAAIAYVVLQIVKHWDLVKAKAKEFADWLLGGFEFWEDALYNTFVQPWIDAWDEVKKLAKEAADYIEDLDFLNFIPGFEGFKNSTAGRSAVKGTALGGVLAHPDDPSAAAAFIGQTDPSQHAAPAGASARGGGGGGANVNVSAPLNVTINGVPDAPKAVEGFESALQRHMRHTFAGMGGGGGDE